VELSREAAPEGRRRANARLKTGRQTEKTML
jgi:hypothetical protein